MRHLPLLNPFQHVRADNRIVHVAAHFGLGQIPKQRKRKGVSHGVNEDVRRELAERFQAQDHRSNTLTQQSKVRIVLGFNPMALLQEHKLYVVAINGDVENILGLLQYGIGRGVYIAGVNYQLGVLVLVL